MPVASMKHTLSRIAQGGGILILLIVVFSLSLTLVYCIPEQALREHGVESAEVVIQEGTYPDSVIEGPLGVDNFTVAWMLNIAVHTKADPFWAALVNEFSGPRNTGKVEQLQAWVDDPAVGEYGTCSRYWNGYLIYLKPLLMFFGIRQIRFLFQLVFIMLLLVAVILLTRKMGNKGAFVGGGLGFSYAIMHGFDAVAVLPMFPSFVISVAGVIWALYVRDERWPIARGFLVIGALTVFFDMLDNPILTLGMPAAILVVRFIDSKSPKWILQTILLAVLAWGIAYGFVWLMKWVLCTVVTGRDIVGNAFRQIDYRTGGGDQGEYNHFTIILKAIAKNLLIQGATIPTLLALMFLFAISLAICEVLKSKKLIEVNGMWAHIGLFALVGIMPYLWYAFAGNHSAEHSFFTYRDQVITVFMLLAAIQWLFEKAEPCFKLIAARRNGVSSK